jgi:hypothetical protein
MGLSALYDGACDNAGNKLSSLTGTFTAALGAPETLHSSGTNESWNPSPDLGVDAKRRISRPGAEGSSWIDVT